MMLIRYRGTLGDRRGFNQQTEGKTTGIQDDLTNMNWDFAKKRCGFHTQRCGFDQLEAINYY